RRAATRSRRSRPTRRGADAASGSTIRTVSTSRSITRDRSGTQGGPGRFRNALGVHTMRIAVVSDIHGNLTALEAVLADLRQVGADLVVQGGDLVGSGSRPAEVIDRIRDLQWPGVFGNSDEMLWKPDRIAEMLGAPQFDRLRDMLLTEIIPSTHETIGPNRLAWLRAPASPFSGGALTVVHARPDDAWRSPAPNALDEELERAYAALASRFVVYG